MQHLHDQQVQVEVSLEERTSSQSVLLSVVVVTVQVSTEELTSSQSVLLSPLPLVLLSVVAVQACF
jgi:hypothetical protein